MTGHLILRDPNDRRAQEGDTTYASETRFLQVPLEREYADVMNGFIRSHYAEISELLVAAGCTDPTNVIQPDWMRGATMRDIEFTGSVEDQRSSAAEAVNQVVERAVYQAAIKQLLGNDHDGA